MMHDKNWMNDDNDCCKRLLHNSFSNTYLSRYNLDSLDYQCQHTATLLWTSTQLPLGAISLTISLNMTLAINRSNQNSRQQLQFFLVQWNQITLNTMTTDYDWVHNSIITSNALLYIYNAVKQSQYGYDGVIYIYIHWMG